MNRAQFKGVFSVEPFDTTFPWMSGPSEGLTTDFESSAYTRTSPMLRALTSDRFFYYCYESLQLVRASSPEQPVLFTEGGGTVAEVKFTPNRVDFALFGGGEGSRLYLNYNWGPGWVSTAGTIEHPPERIASVALQPGQTGRYAFSLSRLGSGPVWGSSSPRSDCPSWCGAACCYFAEITNGSSTSNGAPRVR